MPEPAAPTGRERLRRALTTASRRQLVVAVLLGLVGFAVVTQVSSNDGRDDYSTLRQQDLIDVLDGLFGTTQRTETEISRLEATREDLQSETSRRQAALEQAETEVDTLSILAGVVPVTGPGIRITITEVDGDVEVASLIDTIQELRTVGAEAMQVNGEVRVIAQTSFTDVTDAIAIDGVAVESPYVIDVIGEPDVLSGAITFPLGPRAKLLADGAELRVQKLASLDIEAVVEPQQPEYAQPDGGQ
jgi:uncharacterized protein YlxW (UPF0749 family)